MKLVIAATGASGTIYLQRLLEQIDCAAHEVHLVMSAYAREVAKQELDAFKIPADVSHHSESDMNVPFVSGSARFDAMVIVPCSMATLGRIASGSSDSVLLRAADVFLKERRKLILVPRETPWNLIHARNVVALLEAGAIVLPAKPVTENYLGALWHNRLLIFPLVLQRFFPNRPGAALISASRDGDLLADAIHRFGYDVVRGSSSRLGASAILQLTETLASGRDVVITPDGPRGPAYELGPGIVFLAQKSGALVLPMNLEYSRCWRLGSWDRFIIPQPFSKVRVLISRPLRVKPTSTPEEFEAERRRVQDAMMSLVEMR